MIRIFLSTSWKLRLKIEHLYPSIVSSPEKVVIGKMNIDIYSFGSIESTRTLGTVGPIGMVALVLAVGACPCIWIKTLVKLLNHC